MTDNIGQNLRGFREEELPQTFRDAFAVCRAIGLRYIWIDSFCIVQDDHDDWAKHLVEMRDVYANAYVTLAAGSASDDDDSIFATADVTYIHLSSLTVKQEGLNTNVYFRTRLDHLDSEWPAGEPMPLMTRGWCFQERLLSRRYLCFGENEILWECNEEVACSCSMADTTFSPRRQGETAAFFNSSPIRRRLMELQGVRNNAVAEEWRRLVELYTARSLTYSWDKLPALAGLQQVFELSRQGEYCYGLWLDTLQPDLAWSMTGDESPAGRPRESLPSWSWASAADGRVNWNDLDSNAQFEILEPSTDRRIPQSLPVAKLKLKGIIIPVTVRISNVPDSYELAFPLAKHCEVRELNEGSTVHTMTTDKLPEPVPPRSTPRGRTERRESHPQNLSPTVYHGTFKADYRYWTTTEDLQRQLLLLHFCYMGPEIERHPQSEYATSDEKRWIAGLLLRPRMIPGSENAFERIGWLRYYPGGHVRDWQPLKGPVRTFWLY